MVAESEATKIVKNEIDKDLPISLVEIETIIDRVHRRYPHLSKLEITLIVKSFFERVRFLLVQGDTLSINGFVGKMRIIFFSRFRHGKDCKVVQAKISTPKKFK